MALSKRIRDERNVALLECSVFGTTNTFRKKIQLDGNVEIDDFIRLQGGGGGLAGQLCEIQVLHNKTPRVARNQSQNVATPDDWAIFIDRLPRPAPCIMAKNVHPSHRFLMGAIILSVSPEK